jgi:hypothetical protein
MDKIGIGRRPTSSWLGQTPASPTVNRFQKLGRVGAVFRGICCIVESGAGAEF